MVDRYSRRLWALEWLWNELPVPAPRVITVHNPIATVRLVEAAGAALVGTKLDEAALATMTAAVEAACSPIDDKRGTIEFRTKTAGVLARRAALIAHSRAGDRT